MISGLLLLISGFALGSLPFSYWVARSKGVDLRQHGSGNPGATNVFRTCGPAPGILALALDVGKGASAILLAKTLVPLAWGGALPSLVGIAAVAGHSFSPWMNFRGGKGVATALGVLLALAPYPGLICLLIWCGVLLFSGWVSLASGAAALALPFVVAANRSAIGAEFGWVMGLCLTLSVLVVLRHMANWRRILNGSESVIWQGGSVDAPEPEGRPE